MAKYRIQQAVAAIAIAAVSVTAQAATAPIIKPHTPKNWRQICVQAAQAAYTLEEKRQNGDPKDQTARFIDDNAGSEWSKRVMHSLLNRAYRYPPTPWHKHTAPDDYSGRIFNDCVNNKARLLYLIGNDELD